MAKGSCNCGEYKHEYSGEPVAVALCHCIPCTKTAGQNGSLNSLIKTDNYKQISGTPKTWSRAGDSGKNVTYSICNTCGTIMTVHAEAMPGLTIFKTGTLDDPSEVEKSKPVSEIFTRNRPGWCDAFPGAEQKKVQ